MASLGRWVPSSPCRRAAPPPRRAAARAARKGGRGARGAAGAGGVQRPAGGAGGAALPAPGSLPAESRLPEFTNKKGEVDLEAMEAAGLYTARLRYDAEDQDDEDDELGVFFNPDGTPMGAEMLSALRAQAQEQEGAGAAEAAEAALGDAEGGDDEEEEDGLVWGSSGGGNEEVDVEEEADEGGDGSYTVLDEDGNEYVFDASGNMLSGADALAEEECHSSDTAEVKAEAEAAAATAEMAAAAAEAAAAEAKAKAAAAEAAAAEAKAKAAAAKAEEVRLAAERRSKEARVEVLRAELLAAERELEAEQEPQAAAAPEERSTPAFVFDDEEEGADDGGLGLELDVGGGLAAEAPEAAPQTAAVASQGKANPWDVEFDPDEEDPEDDEGWSDVVIESDVGFSAPSGGAEEVYRVGRGWAQGTNALAADFEEDLPAVGQTYVSGLSAQIEGAMKTRQTRTLRRERKAARREGGDASDKHAAALKGMYGGGDVAAANAIVLTPEELAARAAAGEAGGSAAADSDLAPPKRSVLKVLKIAGGCRTNLKLHSPDGDGTRPMMEKVRVAMFQMIASHMDSPAGVGALPGGRWLDLYAGTGAIGLEAISRGAESAHFCELDPWVVKKCLRRNAKTARFEDRATVHVTRVEDLLRRAAAHPASMGGAFEYMTVCPPYQKCSYPELFGLLEDTPLLTDASYVVVEYPGRLRRHVPDTLRNGALEKFRDRRYGRTWLAIWGPKGRARRVDGEGDSGRARRGAGAAGADKAREPIVIESDGPLPGGYGSRFAKGGAWSNDPDEVVIEG